MLICPQCQFENPNTNNFCQRCGTPLTHKVCPECGTDVPLSEERCQNCGANTGTVWWAIILKAPELGTREELETNSVSPSPQPPASSPSSSSPSPQPPASSPSSRTYLDQNQRYQLLQPLPSLLENAANTEVQVRVLDCQPFQPSPLEVDADSVMAMGIPPIAKTYFALQSQFYQALPSIHDAWRQDDLQVVLITDRSHWPQLIQLWQDDQISHLQIIHWLYEITQLWAALEPYRCCQSLVELQNLRVDEDGVLGLQRLYVETEAGKPLTLQDLGQVWQKLFHESQRTLLVSLIQLVADLQSGNISTIDELRSRLEAIANGLQANLTPTPDLTPATSAAEPEPAATFSDSAAPITLELNEPQQPKSEDMPTLVLPMQLFSLEYAGRTDVGRQRHHNEDLFSIEMVINQQENPLGRVTQARGLYILCDGMGGHAGGEVASNLAVKILQEYFQTHWQSQGLPTEDTIAEAVGLANQAIYDLNQQDARSGIGRMGTTLVMVLLQNTQVAVAHVGDSRLYRLSRQRGLEQVTVDHEVGQREILRGIEPEIAYGRPDAYQLTQALGPRGSNFVNPDVQFLELNEDTLLILTSDGLSDNDLLEHHWHTHLEPLLSSEASLERGVSDLIDLANHYNGHDNITVVVIRAQVYPNQEQQAPSHPIP